MSDFDNAQSEITPVASENNAQSEISPVASKNQNIAKHILLANPRHRNVQETMECDFNHDAARKAVYRPKMTEARCFAELFIRYRPYNGSPGASASVTEGNQSEPEPEPEDDTYLDMESVKIQLKPPNSQEASDTTDRIITLCYIGSGTDIYETRVILQLAHESNEWVLLYDPDFQPTDMYINAYDDDIQYFIPGHPHEMEGEEVRVYTGTLIQNNEYVHPCIFATYEDKTNGIFYIYVYHHARLVDVHEKPSQTLSSKKGENNLLAGLDSHWMIHTSDDGVKSIICLPNIWIHDLGESGFIEFSDNENDKPNIDPAYIPNKFDIIDENLL
jgi:hypothetical protein